MTQIDKYVLYGTRMLVFIEDAPQSNKYRQVHLDAKQFKAVSDAVCTVVNTNGNDEDVEIIMSEDTYPLPDLKEIHD